MDEYGKEAIRQILIERDHMSDVEAGLHILAFEEELKKMAEEDMEKESGFTYTLSDIENLFEEYFSLEMDYLMCFLNDLLQGGK